MTKIEEIRKKTYDDMIRILEADNRCAMIRPTGFGKTGLLTKLIKSKKYQSILYVYPAFVVKDAVLHFYYGKVMTNVLDIPNVEFMTMAKFSRLETADIKKFGYYDVAIFDECHKIGGEKFSENLDLLLDERPDMKILGATATPDRMDAVDVIGRYFGDSLVYNYTLHDAFQDGVLQRPYYVYCAFAKPQDNRKIIEKMWRKELDKIDDEREKLTLAEDLKNKTIEISNLYNMEKVIRRTCDKFTDTNYMKFIVFCSRFESLRTYKKKVIKWFSKAYPEHSVNTLEITSETTELAQNVNKLDDLKPRKNGIDLIFAVDMLNLGYHVENITGVMMCRGTESGIIYIQELGRVLSTGSEKRAIVFDVVDNLHNHAVYSTLGTESIYTKNARARKLALEEKCRKWDEFVAQCKYQVKDSDLDEAQRELAVAQKEFNKADKAHKKEKEDALLMAMAKVQKVQSWLNDRDAEAERFFGGESVQKCKFSKRDESELNGLKRRFEQSRNKSYSSIKKEDLIVVDEVAEYEALISKLVAEPIAIRSNRAWQNYLECGGKYKDDNGVPFNKKDQFLAQTPPENIPLFPFCKVKRVTVDDVMEHVLGIKPERIEDENEL